MILTFRSDSLFAATFQCPKRPHQMSALRDANEGQSAAGTVPIGLPKMRPTNTSFCCPHCTTESRIIRRMCSEELKQRSSSISFIGDQGLSLLAYDGPLSELIDHIDWGTVTSSDESTRTIHVKQNQVGRNPPT